MKPIEFDLLLAKIESATAEMRTLGAEMKTAVAKMELVAGFREEQLKLQLEAEQMRVDMTRTVFEKINTLMPVVEEWIKTKVK